MRASGDQVGKRRGVQQLDEAVERLAAGGPRWFSLAMLVVASVALSACALERDGQDAGPRPGDRSRLDAGGGVADGGGADGGDADGGDEDGGQASADGGTELDAGLADGGSSTDAMAPLDGGLPPHDGGLEPTDGGAPAPGCEQVTFRFEAPQATSVWVTGSFTQWATTPAGGAIPLVQSGPSWSVTTAVTPPGRHQYKFVVDGATWLPDPSNPERVDDGFGGFNSVLRVCEGGVFRVVSHQTDVAARRFTATVDYAGAGDPSSAILTVDQDPAAPGALIANGRSFAIAVDGLSDGIHDLRLSVGSDRTLLKVYVNESTDWRDTLMYFVMTDRFRNGDPSNDAPLGLSNPLTDWLGGDFAGVTQAIQAGYFDDLGVNALWLSWPLRSTNVAWPGPYETYSGCNRTGSTTTQFSGYHGYWPASGRDIEPRFGTMDELKALANAAHARGIRIVLDFTANHMHQDAPIYQSHGQLWFNQPPVLCRDGHWDSHLRAECWFDSFLPDWDFRNPDARRQVIDDAIWMAREVGADGFRVDALKHMADAFVTELRQRVEEELEPTGVTFYLVGETFTGDLGLINYYVNDGMLHGQFDFPSNMAILQGLATDRVGLGAMHGWVRSNKASYGAHSPLMSTFFGNHDIARFVSKAAGHLPCGDWSVSADVSRAHDSPPPQPTTEWWAYRRVQLAMTYVYTVPGVPLVYYGDEVALAGAGDPDNRRMLPSDAELSTLQQETRALAQRLGQTRARHPVLRQGDWTDALFADDWLLVFGRSLGSSKALVVINRGGDRTVSVPVASLGLGDGTTLGAQLGSGSVTVSGGQVSLSVTTLAPEIWVTTP